MLNWILIEAIPWEIGLKAREKKCSIRACCTVGKTSNAFTSFVFNIY